MAEPVARAADGRPVLDGAEARPRRWPHAWWVFLLAGTLAVIAYQLAPDGLLLDVVYVGIGMAAGVAVLVGVRVHQPPRRRAWYALAVSQLLWATGDLTGTVQNRLAPTDAFPTAADIFYLAGYPALALTMYLLIRGRRPRRDVEGRLDSATVAVGLYLLCWVLLARPTAAEYRESWLAAVVAAGYPLLDVTIIAMLVAVVITPGAYTSALRLVLTSALLLMGADAAAAALGLLAWESTTVIDFIWLLSYVVMGSAALHPSMYDLSTASPPEQVVRIGWRRQLATGVALLVSPVILAVEHLLGLPLDVWPIVVGSIAMKLLVFTRMNVAIRQIVAADERRDEAQRDLAYQAAHDSLTGLPNRAQVLELISGTLARAQRSGAMIGLLFVDLDGFKGVNDSFGHRAGDEVLRAVAERMQRVVRGGDVVARLGGDEFVVVLEPVIDEGSAVVVGRRLIREVSAPITLSSGHLVTVGASVGVAISQDARTDADALMVEADTAAYRAKNLGRGRTEVFDAGLRQELQERTQAESRLRTALAEEQLLLRFLPAVDLETGRDIGCEAVVHWEHPEEGLVPVPEFRTAAEQSDLIFDVDSWAMLRAAQQAAEWERRGHYRMRVSVRVSVRHLGRSRVLDDVRAALEASGLEPSRLAVQLSDTKLGDDPVVLDNMRRLREMGVTISLDDFGIGRSSVRRLETLPVDAVKLDGSFLAGSTPEKQGLLPLMVHGARNFGLLLVAKGIAEPEHVERVLATGCTLGQGPLFGPPLAAEEVLARWSGRFAGQR